VVKKIATKKIAGKITSYLTKYITKNDAKFKCQVWNCSRKVSELYTDFYTNTDFTYQFIKLNAVTKEFIDKDFKSPVINIIMIDLTRQTLPLYKRLDNINNNVINNYGK